MSRLLFGRLAWPQAQTTTRAIAFGTVTLSLTTAAFYAKNFAAAEGLEPKPVFGSLGFRTLKLESIMEINHDTKRFVFALPEGDNAVSGIKLTSAILSMSWPKDDWRPVFRPYTPVSNLDEPGHLDLVIKRYPGGRQSSHIHSLQPGDSLTFFGFPLPGYRWTPNKHKHVLLIAGGAGITPIYQLTKGILNNSQDKTKVSLVWGTNTDNDVFFQEEFDELATKFPDRFHAYYTVSRPRQDSQYHGGRVTKEFLQDVMVKESFDVNDGMVFLCGPPAMEDALVSKKDGILQGLGINKKNLHRF